MAVRGRVIGAVAAAVGAGLLTASAVAAPVEHQPIGHYSTPDMATTYPVPLPAEGDVICTGQPVGPYLGEMLAWQEIGELRNLGLPVCDVTWKFGDIADDMWWGYAEATDTATVITLEVDLTEYPAEPDRDLAIRSIVRHEFGHAIVHRAGLQETELRATFTEPIFWHDETVTPGNEVAADAIAAVLAAADDDEQYPMYVEDVSTASIRAAEALVAASVGSDS